MYIYLTTLAKSKFPWILNESLHSLSSLGSSAPVLAARAIFFFIYGGRIFIRDWELTFTFNLSFYCSYVFNLLFSFNVSYFLNQNVHVSLDSLVSPSGMALRLGTSPPNWQVRFFMVFMLLKFFLLQSCPVPITRSKWNTLMWHKSRHWQ